MTFKNYVRHCFNTLSISALIPLRKIFNSADFEKLESFQKILKVSLVCFVDVKPIFAIWVKPLTGIIQRIGGL